MHTYVLISPPSRASLPPSLSHPSRSSQSTKLISLCYAAASHQLTILHSIIVYPRRLDIVLCATQQDLLCVFLTTIKSYFTMNMEDQFNSQSQQDDLRLVGIHQPQYTPFKRAFMQLTAAFSFFAINSFLCYSLLERHLSVSALFLLNGAVSKYLFLARYLEIK